MCEEFTPEEQERWKAWWNLFCNASINIRYYRKREWFFDKCEKLCNSLTVVGGTAVVSQAFSGWPLALGVFIAITGVLPLVFGFAEQRTLFRNLTSRMMEVLRDIECTDGLSKITPEWIEQTKHRINSIEVNEPPSLRRLVTICEVEFYDLVKHPHNLPRVGLLGRLIAHFGL